MRLIVYSGFFLSTYKTKYNVYLDLSLFNKFYNEHGVGDMCYSFVMVMCVFGVLVNVSLLRVS